MVNSPNANAGTLSNQILNFEPADLLNGGGVSVFNQSFSGVKSFANGIRTNTVDVYSSAPLDIGSIAPLPTVINFHSNDISNFRGGVFDVVSIGNNMGLTGPASVFIGQHSGENNTATGTIAIGNYAASLNTTNQIVAIGPNALQNNTGAGNTAVGVAALSSNTTFSRNTAFGYNTLTNSNAFDNTALGYNTLTNIIDGSANTAVGSSALFSLKQSSLFPAGLARDNVAVGSNALYKSTAGDYNVAVGSDALANVPIGHDNVAVGREAGLGKTATTANIREITAIGNFALANIDTGTNLAALGYRALGNNETGNNNTAAGYQALVNNVAGNNNTAVGSFALNGTTGLGSDNTVVGANSAGASETNQRCTSVGSFAMYQNANGTDNTAVGNHALTSNIDGSYNTVLGYSAGGAYNNVESDNILIGHSGIAGENNTIRIGIDNNGPRNHTRNFQAGIAGVTVNNTAFVLIDTTTGQLGTTGTISFSGTIGPTGPAGASGPTGLQGPTGYTGAAGIAQTGPTGLDGVTGPTGAAGVFVAAAPTVATDQNGIIITPTTLNLEFADSTHNGIVSTSLQAFNGTKQFTAIETPSITSVAGGIIRIADGASNYPIGTNALQNVTSGVELIAIGTNALQADTSGSNNIALGQNAMVSNQTGNDNVALGTSALANNNGFTNNVAIGPSALQQIQGNNNIGIGHNAGFSSTAGSDNIYIANNGTNETGVIRIGTDTVHNLNYQAGIVGNTVTLPLPVVIDSFTKQLAVAQKVIAQYYTGGAPTKALTAGNDTFIDVIFDIADPIVSNFDNTVTPGQIIYTGTSSTTLSMTISISVGMTLANNLLEFSIYKNSVTIMDASTVKVSQPTVTNGSFNYTLSLIDNAVNNDNYELHVYSPGNTTLTINSAAFRAYPVY